MRCAEFLFCVGFSIELASSRTRVQREEGKKNNHTVFFVIEKREWLARLPGLLQALPKTLIGGLRL